MLVTTLLVAAVVAVGLVGILVPLLPGSGLVAVALVVWAVVAGTPAGWAVTAVAVLLLGAGAVTKYVVPGRRLRASGTPTSTLLAGAVLGVVGFFVVPVVGLVLGFVLGVYLAEVRRLGHRAARPATYDALRAVGLSVLIELGAALLATLVWGVAVVAGAGR